MSLTREETGLTRHSHPITTSNCPVGIGSIDTASGALNHLVAWSGNAVGLVSAGRMLRGGSPTSSGVDPGSTSRLFLLILRRLLTSSLGDGLGILLVLVHSPVEDVVVLETLTDEEITEDLSQVRVVGLVVKAEGTSVVEVDGELVGESTAEDLGRGGHLLLHDSVVLLLLGSSLQTLPGKGSTAEVEHNVSKGLHVITARLLWEEVSIWMQDLVTGETYRRPSGC
jgi:hypothetical protein